jgi:pimeloyl-ACP methyl ester carboxylesterase
MQRRSFIATATALSVAAALPKPALAAQTQTQEGTTMTTTRPKSGHAPVNGIELYYEIHGAGKPLLLLHGGFGAIEMFGPNLDALSAGRQVIGVDLQGHGRTLPQEERTPSYKAWATDLAELVKWLGYDKVDVMGYSMGAATALRLALDHPEIVGKLVSTSTAYAFAGWHDYNQQGMKAGLADPASMAAGMKQSPLYAMYSQLMPNPEENLVKSIRVASAVVAADYDWSAEIPRITAPTMLVYADWDAVRTAHAASFFELLGGGKQDAGWDGSGMNQNRLAVIPGATHYSIGTDPRLATIVAAFLDA